VKQPRLIVFASLFPGAEAPTVGTFIRERMFRVGRHVPIVVVSPQPWSPFDWLVRLFRRSFRPSMARFERMDNVEVHRPRWLSLPGVAKRFDGWLMWRGSERCVRELHRQFHATAIDAHFLYPDGWAAARIAQRLALPCTITLRGSKDEWLIGTDRERLLVEAMNSATKLFSVSESLKRNVAEKLGVAPQKVTVIGNGVDTHKFRPVDRIEARRRIGVSPDAEVMIGVGGLISRKGFHRVIPLIPWLRERHPRLLYLIVGGGTTQADMRGELEALARQHGVSDCVVFCGQQNPGDLSAFYSAADVFVLATEHEGWANVFLEAMACGLPIVTTRVGGNAEVVLTPTSGELVEWWNPQAFASAIDRALAHRWDREAIIAYARSNSWDFRVERLLAEFRALSCAGEILGARANAQSGPSASEGGSAC